MANTLLAELDGLSDRAGVYIVAATNRPEIIDPAMLRPGRLDTLLYVPLPTSEERVEILKTLCRGRRLKSDVDLAAIGSDSKMEGFRYHRAHPSI